MTTESKTIFHALDLDRTLFNTSFLVKKIIETTEEAHPEIAAEVRYLINEYARKKESFFIFEYLKEVLSEPEFDNVLDELEHNNPSESFLLPGASERLSFATSRPGWSVGILTFGDAVGQNIKLRVGGLEDVPALITDTPHKGVLIDSWKQPGGGFMLPAVFGAIAVDMVCLDDDKRTAFYNLPQGARGQWITQSSITAADDLAEALPENVVQATDLFASIQHLKTIL